MKLVLMILGLLLTTRVNGMASTKSDVSDARRVFNEVQGALNEGELVKHERTFEYCEPYQDASRALYVTASEAPRLYVQQAGSDDSAVTWNFYYDEQGRLRFVFITAGAVNGTQLEHRIWISVEGKRVKEQQTLIEGPGYTFPKTWPEHDLVTNPKCALRSPNPCRELSSTNP